jgi:hypothetical protein
MLLDKPNAELLKLIALCKDVPRSHRFPDVYLLSECNAERLQNEGLIFISADERFYRVTRQGYDLLQHCGYDYQPDERREYAKHVLDRREKCAQVMITLLLAGADVFSGKAQEHSYLSAANVRRNQRKQSRNLIGSSRFTGVTGNGYVYYYLTNARDSLVYNYETDSANKLLPRRNASAVIYMGQDYQSLCAAVTGTAGTKATYRTAYDNFKMPVCLCPCSPDGAVQMRVMLQKDYKARLIQTIFPPDSTFPPNKIYGDCDGVFDGEPFLIGIDMDIKRIGRVAQAAKEHGKNAHIFARQCQGEALKPLFQDRDIRFYRITDEDIKTAFSFQALLAEPPIEPYITTEGRYIHDEAIRICREARKANRKKDKAFFQEE